MRSLDGGVGNGHLQLIIDIGVTHEQRLPIHITDAAKPFDSKGS